MISRRKQQRRNIGLLLLSIVINSISIGQNIKDEVVEYRYIKLPMTPLNSTVQNYQSIIYAPYEEENNIKKQKYEAEKKIAQDEFDKAKNEYPSKVKQAEEKYNAEMEEWKKKSFGEKVVETKILGENNKPVKQTPSAPYLRNVQEPDLKTSYNYTTLANTYLILDGYKNNQENAVKVEVTINGFDYTEPRQLSEQKSVTSFSNGGSQTNNVTYYHNEFSFRHAMSVKVSTPDGKELFNITPQELNNYKIYKSPESTTPVAINSQLLVKTNEEKILQDNLTFINNLVNDKIGYKRVTRKPELSFVKSKDETYQDLLIAFNDASAGLKILVDDKEAAKVKLQNAVQLWNKALLESDVKNKKARIDKDVTIAICFNLLECFLATYDLEEANKIITTLNAIDLSSSKRKLKEEYEALFNDAKQRMKNNK